MSSNNTDASKKAKAKYNELHSDKVKASQKSYYQRNRETLLKKKKEKYVKKTKIPNDTSRNLQQLKKILGDLDGWKVLTSNDSLLSNMNLKNKLTNGKCLHCLCGHRTGKYVKKIITTPTSDKNLELDKACDEVHKQLKKTINKNAENSITDCYEESSLIPMMKKGCDYYILVGKVCCEYFNMSEEEIKTAFKENIAYKKELRNPVIKKKMSCDPKILLKDFEIFDFGKYRGMSIYHVNTLKGGEYYLENVCSWSVSDATIEAIEDLLYQNTL